MTADSSHPCASHQAGTPLGLAPSGLCAQTGRQDPHRDGTLSSGRQIERERKRNRKSARKRGGRRGKGREREKWKREKGRVERKRERKSDEDMEEGEKARVEVQWE